MALILNGGAIFLHIPKTGGNWIPYVLKISQVITVVITNVSVKHCLHHIIEIALTSLSNLYLGLSLQIGVIIFQK